MLERIFHLREQGTNVRRELGAGLTTFLTMAYIIVVQPLVLSGKMFGMETGLDFGAVMTATCLSAALATLIMALYANYPIVQAPGMGENFFFVFSVLPAAAAATGGAGWQAALGVVFLSGLLFLGLSLLGVRESLINAVSPSLKNAMAVGIGLFIAFIGLQNAGLVVTSASIVQTPDGAVLSPGTLVKLTPHLFSADTTVFLVTLLLTVVLLARKVRGAIIWGVVGATLFSLLLKWGAGTGPFYQGTRLVEQFTPLTGVFSAPPSLAPTFFKMDLAGALQWSLVPFIIIFLFMDLFDTLGTLIGVSEQAGFIRDNKLPRAGKALVSDAVGTVVGAAMGTSTVTSFIESAAGVEAGGRTGLTGVTAAFLFLAALFLYPVVAMVGSYPVITAPALVVVGAMMLRNVRKIDWDDFTEAFPAFLMLVGIPLTYSIADGLALGFVFYPLVKILAGRGREVHWLLYLLALLLLGYFLFLRSGI